MAGLKDIAKRVGLLPLKLDDGRTVDVIPALEAFFSEIVEECRTPGNTVRIKDFGTFSARMMKGRRLNTPLLKDEESSTRDLLLMKFKQHDTSKQRLNANGAVTEWGGTYVEKEMRPSDVKKAQAAAEAKEKREAKKKAEIETASRTTTAKSTEEELPQSSEKKSVASIPSKKKVSQPPKKKALKPSSENKVAESPSKKKVSRPPKKKKPVGK